MQWNLIKLRRDRGLSQGDVAKILGVSEGTYRNKEVGKTQFKMDEMFILADYFEEDISDIFLDSKYTVREFLG